jgi:hypothetical protein
MELICEHMDENLGLYHSRSRRKLIRFVADRPGRNRRYALDSTKINRSLGWSLKCFLSRASGRLRIGISVIPGGLKTYWMGPTWNTMGNNMKQI